MHVARWIRGAIALSLFVPALAPAVVVAAPSDQSAALVQVAHNAKLGDILVDSNGMTLYILTSEADGTFHCVGGCLKFWPPLYLPAGMAAPTAASGVMGTLGTVTRPDGTVQVTYNGLPLYHFIADKAPGDTNGNGIKAFEGLWMVATAASVPVSHAALSAQGAAGRSASFTVNFSSSKAGMGQVYFGSGPGCAGLVEVATQDAHSNTTSHSVRVTGNDLPGTVGDIGIQPGATYWFEVVTVSSSGVEIGNNAGKCYSVTVPSA